MTTRESVHRLVDDLPQDELIRAERVLEALLATADASLSPALRDASGDDEPETPEERAAVEKALRDVEQGRTTSHADVKRRWGLAG